MTLGWIAALAGSLLAVAALGRMLARERAAARVLRERLQVVSRLHDAGRALNSAHELDQVLDTILSGVVEMLTANAGSVMLLDGDSLVVVATVGNEHIVGLRAGIADGIAGQVARTRESLLIDGEATPARFPGLVTRTSRVDSAISVPMVENDELIGVLNIAAPPSRVFADQDLGTARAFAEYAAAAIAKARRYESSRRTSEELAYRATHDSLTGLANRTLLRDTVVHADTRRRAATNGALLFIDLDGFKAVNDVLGHAGGDMLLEAVARRITAAVSSADIAARVGGDEFAVFLSTTTQLAAAITVADRILERLAESFLVDGRSVTVSASIGIALLGLHGHSYDELMKAADCALYDAKNAGKSRWQVCSTTAAPETVLPPHQRGPAMEEVGAHGGH